MATPGSRLRRSTLKGAAILVSLICLVGVAHFFDLESITDPDWVELHLRQGPTGILLFMALAAFASAAGAPRQALAALGGYAFGALWGCVLVGLALPLGCALGFWYARLLGRSSLQRRFGPRIARLEAFLAHSPFAMTVAIRFLPVGHNALTNMLAGITHIPFAPFFLGSAVGYLPQSIIFCLLGSGLRVDPLWRTAAACVLFVVSTLIGMWLYGRYRRDLSEEEG